MKEDMTREELETIILDATINDILLWAKHDDMNSLYGFLSARVFSDFKDISDEIGMHESTVSRVTNSKLILTEWGVMPLKNFFSASISGSENSELHAASAVRETIKNLISSEITGKPLSDDKLAGILNKEGMDVARRTVAKYRDMLNIPSSSQRRKQARLMKFASN